MLVLLPVRSLSRELRCMLQVNRESVTTDRRIEVLILKIEAEAQLVAIECDRPIKIVDEKLRGDARNLRCSSCHRCHAIPRSKSVLRVHTPRQPVEGRL